MLSERRVPGALEKALRVASRHISMRSNIEDGDERTNMNKDDGSLVLISLDRLDDFSLDLVARRTPKMVLSESSELISLEHRLLRRFRSTSSRSRCERRLRGRWRNEVLLAVDEGGEGGRELDVRASVVEVVEISDEIESPTEKFGEEEEEGGEEEDPSGCLAQRAPRLLALEQALAGGSDGLSERWSPYI